MKQDIIVIITGFAAALCRGQTWLNIIAGVLASYAFAPLLVHYMFNNFDLIRDISSGNEDSLLGASGCVCGYMGYSLIERVGEFLQGIITNGKK